LRNQRGQPTAVKSVSYDTELLIIENKKPKVVKIGEWINNYIDNPSSKNAIVYYGQKDANMELLDVSKQGVDAYVLSCDNNGSVNWHQITNVTRHDPSSFVYKIKTKWGRNVTVVESKSLLIWNEKINEFEQKDMSTVNIGDKVPLTFNSPNTPSLTFIDVKQYLGEKYVLGKDLQQKKFDIISTNMYSKYAKHTSPSIPSEFAMNADNGFMIGLYLADGNTSNDYVSIAKNDEHIRNIIRKWFDDNKIIHRTQIKKENPEVPGLSISTRGYSTIHAEFFDNLLGKHAHGKYIPYEAFLGPDEFVKGLIDGYFSGDGCITDYHVQASSVSQKLIYGISQLLSRYGIFCKISMIQEKPHGKIQNIQPRYTLSIQSKYVYKFAKTFSLSMKYKQEKLQILASKTTLDNMSYLYKEQNDVILDSIVSIEKIDANSHTDYKKVYDITVPDTLNFQLFNGMNVADTSDVGYLQRKLVKAMEDCKVNYDYTVRNASGSIVQFLYGEDGMDPCKIETQRLPFVNMDYSKLKKTYLLTDEDNLKYILETDVIEDFYKNKGWQDKFRKHFEEVLEDREFVMKNILAKNQDSVIMYPVSFQRITTNAKAMFNKYDNGVLSDLDPIYVLDTINKLCDELYVSKSNHGNKFMKMLIRCYLSPKKVIFEYKYNKIAFDYVVNQIKQRFYDSIANPSEMVGVVAAQSIGEPATQMCSHKDTIIRLTGPNNYTFVGKISEFVDTVLEKNKDKAFFIGHDHIVLDLETDYNVIGVSNDEKTSWRRISQVSRHPANGGLVKVYTKSGKTTTATLTHSFLKRTTDGIGEVKGSDLKIGDRIPIAKQIPEVKEPTTIMTIGGNTYKLDKAFGWFIGAYLAHGSINGRKICITKVAPEFETNIKSFAEEYKHEFDTVYYQGQYGPSKDNNIYDKELAKFLKENFGNGSYNKFVGSFVYGCSKEFITGILSGYFDGDGCTSAEKQMIRCSSRCERLIDDICVLLAYCGVFASKLQETTKRQPGKIIHTLCIQKKYAQQFANEIGFNTEDKANGLQAIIQYNKNLDDRSSVREEIDMIPELGKVIADIGKKLALPGQSRTYGRWTKKSAIGRRTLGKYIEVFSEANSIVQNKEVTEQIQKLVQAYVGDVIWDEIVELEYLDDPMEYVYDFTVPGNDSFMVDTCVLVHNTLNTSK
jgi:intein/homing endonuclease